MTNHSAGDEVRGYRIVGTLGRGGLGTTFEAARAATGERVALKRLAMAEVDDWKRLELFEREARVLSRLEHPAIPRYLEHFTVDGPNGATLYIAQDLVEGQSLADVVASAGRPLDETEVRRIAEELLRVLDYLGREVPPVIHRDIKPENVLRRRDGSIALVDFGAARAEWTRPQGGSTTVGTYGYMAPEQLHGGATPATDIYGLASTLLFLLTGRSPTELPRRKLKIDVAKAAPVTGPFARWLDKALEPAVEDRFPSAASALVALRGLPGGGGPPVSLESASRLRMRPLTWTLVAVLVVVVGLAGAVGFDAKRALRAARSGHPERTGPGDLPERWKTNRWSPSISLVRTIGAHMSAVFMVAVSPDGEQIASVSNDGTVKVWQLRTGEPVRSFPGHTARVGAVAWSPDGKLLLSAGDTTVLVQDASTGAIRFTLKVEGGATSVNVSPDGKRVVAGGLSGKARVWSLDTGAELLSIDHGGRVLRAAFSPDNRTIATSGNTLVRVWDANTGAPVSKLVGNAKDVGALAWAPDGRVLFTGGDDRTLRAWIASEGHELWRAQQATDEVWNIAVDGRGKYVAAVSKDGWLRIHDAMSGALKLSREVDKKGVLSVAWAPDGETIVVGQASGSVDVLSVASGSKADRVPAMRADAPLHPVAKTPNEELYFRVGEVVSSPGSRPEALAEAANALRDAMKTETSDEGSALLLVGLSRVTKDHEASDKLITEALARVPNYAEAHVQRGWNYYMWGGDDVRAKDEALLADKLRPTGRSMNLLAALARRAKDFDSAERYATQAIAVEARTQASYSYQVLRDVWQSRGDYEAEERVYEREIEADPANAWAKGNFAEFLIWRGSLDRAIEMARSALQQVNYLAARQILGNAYAEKGADQLWIAKRPELAKAAFDEAVLADSQDAHAHYGLGACFRKMAFDHHDKSLLVRSNQEFDVAAKLDKDPAMAIAARADNDRLASRVASAGK